MSEEQLSDAWSLFTQDQCLDAAIAFRNLLEDGCSAEEERHQAEFGLGYSLAFLGEFEEAYLCFFRLRVQAAARNDLSAEHRALHQIGMVERMAEKWEAAHACFAEERLLIQQLGSPDLEVAVNAYELGTVTLRQGLIAESKTWFERSLSHAQQTTDLVAVGCAYRGLGDWEGVQGHAQEAVKMWEASRHAFIQAGETKASEEVRLRMLPFQSESQHRR
jgi:tetratricopeptide (TPR) repeat protein